MRKLDQELKTKTKLIKDKHGQLINDPTADVRRQYCIGLNKNDQTDEKTLRETKEMEPTILFIEVEHAKKTHNKKKCHGPDIR